MNFREGPQKRIESFLEEKKESVSLIFENTLFVCRNDGVVLYFHSNDSSLNKNSIGALVGGLWQAGSAVTSMFNSEHDEHTFRLSFDTSSRGVHILPFTLNDENFFMGLYFSEIVNPGMVKNKLRIVLDDMKESLKDYKGEFTQKNSENELFKNITDDEMNNLFSFAEN